MKLCEKRKQEALEKGYIIDLHGNFFYVGKTFIDTTCFKNVKYVVIIPETEGEYAIFDNGTISEIMYNKKD